MSSEKHRKHGNEFFAKKQYAEALVCYEAAIVEDENSKEAWFNKGMCHKKLNQQAKAKEAFCSALALDSSYEKANYHLKLLELPAHAIFAVVDIKLTDDNKIKILELGAGANSGLDGFSKVYPEKEPITSSHAMGKIMPSFSCVEWDEYSKTEAFKRLKTSKHSPRGLSYYKAICTHKNSENKFRQLPPEILVMDKSPEWYMVARNKHLMHEIFSEELLVYRPRSKVYSQRYDFNLANDIKTSIPATKYVLKLPHLSKGNGVFIVRAEDLDITLQMLLNEKESMCEAKLSELGFSVEESQSITQYGEVWRMLNPGLFLVEEYCQSKIVQHEKKKYDPTMRVVFTITVDEGQAKFIPLGFFWKFPPKPLGEGHLREQTISESTPDTKFARVEKHDENAVYKQLNNCLPNIFLRMLVLLDVPKISRKFDSKYRNILLHYYARALSIFNRSKEALITIKAVEKTDEYYFQKGVIYSNLANYEKAIEKFNKLIEKESNFSGLTFFHRGKALMALNKDSQAINDFKRAGELGVDKNMLREEAALRVQNLQKR